MTEPLPADDEVLLTVAQAAAVLQVHERTVRRLIAAGQLPHVRLFSSRRIRRSTLHAWIAAREAATATLDRQ